MAGFTFVFCFIFVFMGTMGATGRSRKLVTFVTSERMREVKVFCDVLDLFMLYCYLCIISFPLSLDLVLTREHPISLNPDCEIVLCL